MWHLFQLFDIVARTGSFAAAAGAAGLSAVSLARRIDTLEHELDAVLFLRGPAGLTLTEAGQRLHLRLAAALDRMAEDEADLRHVARVGDVAPVRVSATEPIIAELLAPALPDLMSLMPRLTVELQVADAVVSLPRREAEVAVRLARPKGDSLLVRRIARLGMGVYRRPGSSPEEAEVIGYDDKYGDIAEVQWLRVAGLRPRIRMSSTRGILQAVRAGAGIAVLPDVLALPGLVTVPGLPPVPPRDVWLMVHRDVARRAEVRKVMHWILRAFRTAAVASKSAAS
jgi:DNA-binding transcriptional LysR family regulator